MAQRYFTKITKARFVTSPFSGQQMAGFGQTLIESIFDRWDRGVDANDAPARPLAAKYAVAKQRQFARAAIRDLHRSGRLRRAIKVLSANQNKVTLGPTEGMHTRLKRGGMLSFADVLTINNRRSLMWAVAPSERRMLIQLFRGQHPVRAERLKVA